MRLSSWVQRPRVGFVVAGSEFDESGGGVGVAAGVAVGVAAGDGGVGPADVGGLPGGVVAVGGLDGAGGVHEGDGRPVAVGDVVELAAATY